MKRYFKYAWYVIKHKWFVFLECSKRGLVWRGLVHDISKLRISEFLPYANFFGRPNKVRNETGYYKPTDTGDANFERAWFLHQKRNSHHWQYWVLPCDGGEIKVLEIPLADRTEMLCDWIGAGHAQKTKGVPCWYETNKDKLTFAPNTRKWIEEEIAKL